MPEKTEYAPGTPCWVDLASPDVEASKRFYGDLFGWTAGETGPVEETGGYVMFMLREQYVAGLGPLQEGQPPAWSTYISVTDADTTTKAAKDLGATAVLEPMDVLDAGRMAVFIDPTGAAFSIWQPNQHVGAQLVNEPGAPCWNELDTRDTEKSKAFYTELFGWGTDAMPMGEGGGEYTIWTVDGQGVGGMLPMPDMVPDVVPNNWLTSFAVDDCDASVTKLESLGGSVLNPAQDMEGVGRFAIVADPHGAAFSVIRLAQQSS
jgi:predicted enzyme related to lactoylglutathione lyase